MHVLITGVTGMVGEGVMHICLNHSSIKNVTIVSRKSTGVNHPKLKEIIHSDFFDLSVLKDKWEVYDACFFCLGVTSINKSEEEYFKYTNVLTLHFAKQLLYKSSNAVFCYVSGAGTDSSEKGKVMWARVKGKTENDISKLGFRKSIAFRPGYIQPLKGMKHTHGFYKWVQFMYPFLNKIIPQYMCRLEDIGYAMIQCVNDPSAPDIAEVNDIKLLAKTFANNS